MKLQMQKERCLHVNNVIVETNVGYKGRKNSNSEEQEQEKGKKEKWERKRRVNLKLYSGS